jgi:hypothetical protein
MMFAKLICMVRGHKWSRWHRDYSELQTRFCKRGCGVQREQRKARPPQSRKPKQPVEVQS